MVLEAASEDRDSSKLRVEDGWENRLNHPRRVSKRWIFSESLSGVY